MNARRCLCGDGDGGDDDGHASPGISIGLPTDAKQGARGRTL